MQSRGFSEDPKALEAVARKVEAELENATDVPLFIDSVTLVPAPGLACLDVNTQFDPPTALVASESSLAQLDFDALMEAPVDSDFLKPGCARQFLYRLTPAPGSGTLLRTVTSVGKLDIVWKTGFGEAGRLQTSQLARALPPAPGLAIEIDELPDVVAACSPFVAVLKVTNESPAPVALRLHVAKATDAAIALDGVSGTAYGELRSGASLRIPLHLFATRPGMHPLRGIHLVDTHTGNMYEARDLAVIFVEPPHAAPSHAP